MWVDMLAGAARAYRYFKADRLAQAGSAAAARTPGPAPFERESPKVGRNDPCPCGSGKKYKRCCGSPKSGNRVVH
jgi:preprotein translocase subunit SecA